MARRRRGAKRITEIVALEGSLRARRKVSKREVDTDIKLDG